MTYNLQTLSWFFFETVASQNHMTGHNGSDLLTLLSIL